MSRLLFKTSLLVFIVSMICLTGVLVMGQAIPDWELVYARSILPNSSGWQIYLYDIHRDLSTPFYFAPASVESINSHFRRELDISFTGPAVSLSPDRRFLVREGFSPTGVVLYVHDLETGLEFTRTDLSAPLIWSPDSRMMVIQTPISVVGLVEIDGEGQWGEMVSFLDGLGLSMATPDVVWSPQGTIFAFESLPPDPDSEPDVTSSIYVLHADGSDLRNLTPNLVGSAMSPFWSPDATRIGFIYTTPDTWNMYVVNADGTDLHHLIESNVIGTPAWSPDGTMIAYNVSLVPTSGLAVYTLADNEVMIIPNVGTVISAPVWSPDSRYLLYLEYDPINPLTDESYLQIVDLQTGNIRRLINEEVIWLP